MTPGLLLLLADQRLPRLDDRPLVGRRLARMLLREDVEVRLAHRLGRVGQSGPPGHGSIDADEATLDVLEVDRVRHRVHDRGEQVTLLEDGLLGLLPLHELADLAADGGQHPEQLLVGLLDLAAEDLHDAQDVAADRDREPERPVQPDAGRGRRPREIPVRDDVRDPGRLAAGPDASRQADAPANGCPSAQGHELFHAGRRRMPDLAATQDVGLRVDPPHRAQPASPARRRPPARPRTRRRRAGAIPPGLRVAAFWTARRRSARRRSRSMRSIDAAFHQIRPARITMLATTNSDSPITWSSIPCPLAEPAQPARRPRGSRSPRAAAAAP